MRLWIEGDRLGADLGFNRLDDLVSARRLLANDRHRSVTATGAEDKAGFDIDDTAIGTWADLECLENLTAVGIGDHELPIGTGAEEPALFGIEGEAGRLFAGSKREPLLDLECSGVELDDFACVLHVDKNVSLFVGDSQFGDATEAQAYPTAFISSGSIAVVSLLP